MVSVVTLIVVNNKVNTKIIKAGQAVGSDDQSCAHIPIRVTTSLLSSDRSIPSSSILDGNFPTDRQREATQFLPSKKKNALLYHPNPIVRIQTCSKAPQQIPPTEDDSTITSKPPTPPHLSAPYKLSALTLFKVGRLPLLVPFPNYCTH
ncbi:hypothetical protein CROQUDRAFT_100744 [Cronartium quercuum f. sp. fusiforme G11]|uniref:Uncharacterized protein n=1 Tax=Cronartium quercuum f. sp. fusiforme G11 TaxID=708437 RepID=A0A9P6N5X4_9BASI|nr:hypothetical protein CROQUDRAFT_100744 [Cronartium quercuum f. sp. fusiforme G11]